MSLLVGSRRPSACHVPLAGRLPSHSADGDFKAFPTDLKRFGPAPVQGLGEDPEAGPALGVRIGSIQETFFGRNAAEDDAAPRRRCGYSPTPRPIYPRNRIN